MRPVLRPAIVSCLVLLALLAVDRPAKAQRQIYVTDGASVKVYDAAADGNVAPVRVLSGPATNLTGNAFGIAVDEVHNEMYVVSNNAIPINVFPLSAHGNVAPTRSISGAATTLTSPNGIALDLVNDEIIVVNNGKTLVFSRTASGNVAPLRTINNAGQRGVSVDTANNEIAVTLSGIGGEVDIFSRTASGNVSPLRAISGSMTTLNLPTQAILDAAHNELPVTNTGSPTVGPYRITVFLRTANGNVAPLRTIEGASTQLASPYGMILDPVNDELIVVNAGIAAAGPGISFFPRTASGNVAPSRRIAGAATQLSEPLYVGIGPAFGNTFFTLTPCRLIDTRNPNGPYGGPALAANLSRSFTLAGQCGIPSNVTAVAVNVTITQPTGLGDLRIFPGGAPLPLVSTLNWRLGQTRANNAVISLGSSGDITVPVDQASGTVHFILDVNGYFQ